MTLSLILSLREGNGNRKGTACRAPTWSGINGYELPLAPSLIKEGVATFNRNREVQRDHHLAGELGVSPILHSPPKCWGTIRGFGYCFPLSRGIAGG